MGLETLEIPDEQEPIKSPQKEDPVQRVGDYLVTRTYHGSVFENQKFPRYIRYNLLDTSFNDRIIKKRSIIFNENDETHIERKERIVHTAKVLNGIKTNYLEEK